MAKTKEQIDIAKTTVDLLEDYIELAKTEKKLKIQTNIKALQARITETVDAIVENVKEL